MFCERFGAIRPIGPAGASSRAAPPLTAPSTMSNRFAFAAIAASLALTACGSTGSGATSSQAPVYPGDSSSEAVTTAGEGAARARPVKPWAPAPWTGSFTSTAVMLAHTFRIEGPEGLLEHVVASSDDEFYERSVEMTPDGLMQIIRRLGPEVPEIRVQLDGWTLAAFDRVTIVERVGDSPVRVIASGEALWRDANGRIAQGQRIECIGEIGDDTPAIPDGASQATVPAAVESTAEDASMEAFGPDTAEPLGTESAEVETPEAEPIEAEPIEAEPIEAESGPDSPPLESTPAPSTAPGDQ
ncbi:MAG: hypothetical protein ACJAZN_002544 [Planctomycetota bacterium]